MAWIEVDPTFGTDRLTSALLGFAGGGQLAFSVSTRSVRYQRIQLVGTTGRIEIEIPFNAPEAEPCRYMVQRAGAFITGLIVPLGIEPGPFLQIATMPVWRPNAARRGGVRGGRGGVERQRTCTTPGNDRQGPGAVLSTTRPRPSSRRRAPCTR